ncbi:MAG: DUF2851 family protein [Muribaculaceae bacterium]|nr:DUF2851 family protein [Muribaculaceae bacterium]
MERIYQFLWQYSMLGRRLKDVDANVVEVIDPGCLNRDAGPDFFNAKIRINGTEWVGNVEVHVKASDWHRHNHQEDPAYDNIILHVVAIDDRRITRADGSLIPQVALSVPPDFYTTYQTLSEHPAQLRCGQWINEMSGITVTDWLESLAIERLRMKCERVTEILAASSSDWEQTCFIILARALGFGLNGEPFEMLARSIPLRILHHHSNNPLQIQAILFGQAGMLDQSQHIFDEYYQLLCREYYFLARKYGLRPMRGDLWKYARTRPQNFPHRRIAFLAKACEGGFSMLSRLVSAVKDGRDLREIFGWRLEGYWHDHFAFDVAATTNSDTLSGASIRLLTINAVAPLVYAFAMTRGDVELGEKGAALLENLPPENNSLIRDWAFYGLVADNALRSQALIHLRREYCEKRKCLYCRFAHSKMRKVLGIRH